jgi:TPR repeat protein
MENREGLDALLGDDPDPTRQYREAYRQQPAGQVAMDDARGRTGGISNIPNTNWAQDARDYIGDQITIPGRFARDMSENALTAKKRYLEEDPSAMAVDWMGGGIGAIERAAGAKYLSEGTGKSISAMEEHAPELGDWFKKKVTPYLNLRMGTADDEVRRAIDNKMTGLDGARAIDFSEYSQRRFDGVNNARKELGKTDEAKRYESHADTAIERFTPEEYAKAQRAYGENQRTLNPNINELSPQDAPWVAKLPADTPLYNLPSAPDLRHVSDVLKEQLANGTITAGQLKTITLEGALKRTHEYDKAAKRAADKAAKQSALSNLSATPHTQYETGYQWAELPSTHTPEGLEAVKNISSTTGWCTKGDCHAKGYGDQTTEKGNKLYALLDKEGTPHVQIHATKEGIFQIKPRANSWNSQMVKDEIEKNPNYREEITPYMDDMVKKLGLPVKGDLDNTGLHDLGDGVYDTVAGVTKRGEEGDIAAQRYLASAYGYPGYGSPVKGDPKTAIKWFTQAAEQGDPKDQFNLASYIRRTDRSTDSKQVKQEKLETAALWFKRAAEQGHEEAMYKVGKYGHYGLPEEERDVLMRKLADKGHVGAMYELAWDDVNYAKATNEPVTTETIGWLNKVIASEHGARADSANNAKLADASEMLGDIYATTDKKKAIEMYKQAISYVWGLTDKRKSELKETIAALKAELKPESPINKAIRSAGGNVAEWLGHGPIKARR